MVFLFLDNHMNMKHIFSPNFKRSDFLTIFYEIFDAWWAIIRSSSLETLILKVVFWLLLSLISWYFSRIKSPGREVSNLTRESRGWYFTRLEGRRRSVSESWSQHWISTHLTPERREKWEIMQTFEHFLFSASTILSMVNCFCMLSIDSNTSLCSISSSFSTNCDFK